MAENEIQQRGPAGAWDRVGKVLGDMASAAESVGNRNLTLWNTVSENIRHKKNYGADDVVNDTAKVMAAAMDNVEDIWSTLTGPPATELIARPVPTAFLYFAWQDNAGYSPADPVWILVARPELNGLPDAAVLELDAPDEVKNSLRVRKDMPKGYVVESRELGEAEAGTYSGTVYVDMDPRPRVLANLRVVVQGKGQPEEG
jgi:peptidoglycan hydrolase-like protein with peptidoglycan-binding domain